MKRKELYECYEFPILDSLGELACGNEVLMWVWENESSEFFWIWSYDGVMYWLRTFIIECITGFIIDFITDFRCKKSVIKSVINFVTKSIMNVSNHTWLQYLFHQINVICKLLATGKTKAIRKLFIMVINFTSLDRFSAIHVVNWHKTHSCYCNGVFESIALKVVYSGEFVHGSQISSSVLLLHKSAPS